MALLRICLASLAAAAMLALAACGNREPQERAAFISLLQSRLAAGTLVPIGALSAAEKEAVGRYDDAYDLMVDFQAAMAKAAQRLRPVLAAERIQSVDDIVRRREALQAARKTLADSAGALQQAKARAVTAPAAEFMGAAAGMDTVARDALGVADFVSANGASITLEDGQAKVATPSLQQALNLRLQGLNAQSQALEQARATLSRAAAGS